MNPYTTYEKRASIMAGEIFPHATAAHASERRKLAPGIEEAFRAFSDRVFADGVLQ
jgi:hypothetical protein